MMATAGRPTAWWVVALLAFTAAATTMPAAGPGRGGVGQGQRVVDRVAVGDPASECEHEVEARDAAVDVDGGRVFRQVRGSLSYSLRVYDDSEVVLECVVLGPADPDPFFELLVEGRPVATRLASRVTPGTVTVRHRVPFELTRGLTAIRVTVRVAAGAAPRLLELRTVQEHLERVVRRPSPFDPAGRSRAQAGLGSDLRRAAAAF